MNLNANYLDEILNNYPEEVNEIFKGRCNSKRHELFFSENYDLKRAQILNAPENQIPVIFSDNQLMHITNKCGNLYEEKNEVRATGEKRRYLEYVIIPEIEIMIFRFLKNMSTNHEAELYLVDNYSDYHGETFDVSGFD